MPAPAGVESGNFTGRRCKASVSLGAAVTSRGPAEAAGRAMGDVQRSVLQPSVSSCPLQSEGVWKSELGQKALGSFVTLA